MKMVSPEIFRAKELSETVKSFIRNECIQDYLILLIIIIENITMD